jgi:S1-C subfamily serine protease
MKSQRFYLLITALILISVGIFLSNFSNISWPNFGNTFFLPNPFSKSQTQNQISQTENVKVVNEESIVIDVVDKASSAVVTVGITKTTQAGSIFEIDPFNPFAPYQQSQGASQNQEQDIGSGFIVSADGLVVTNKHVVSDTQAKYRIITKDDKTYDVQKIYRDPVNDLAILKISANKLPTVAMGDSTKIKVGQLAIAIGTALGEFRSTVTTGVISGVGRGITAGSALEGYAERLDNVIQTDAAINPGNSGGPLLNSSGQVIGINAAVSSEGQNIGFALPINVVKEALDNFNKTGQFNRPYLGVRYKVVTKDVAVMNEIPEGAYIIDVIDSSPAAKTGLMAGDIITKIDDSRLSGTNAELSKIISNKKVGDTLKLSVWRDGKEKNINVVMGSQDQ